MSGGDLELTDQHPLELARAVDNRTGVGQLQAAYVSLMSDLQRLYPTVTPFPQHGTVGERLPAPKDTRPLSYGSAVRMK